jgi:hypothetical protein
MTIFVTELRLKELTKMLDKIEKDLQKHIKQGKEEAKKFLNHLFDQHFPNSIPNFAEEIKEKMLPFSRTQNRLIEQLTFVESMIQKLSQPEIELTDEEKEFLGRLFLASKLGSSESMKDEFDEHSKKLQLMSEIVYLSLSRYIHIILVSSRYMVRNHLIEIKQAETFYVKAPFNNLTWYFKDQISGEFSKIAKELTESEIRYCAERYNAFKQQISDFKFNELLSNFQKRVSIFSDQFPNSSIDFVFSQENSDVFKSLLESLLTLESTFLDEKKKFQQFSKQIQTFLNEINTKLKRIFDSQREYETCDFGDCPHARQGYTYEEPLSDVNSLIMKLIAVWKNKCHKNCEACTLSSHQHSRMDKYPNVYGKIVHTRVVMTPVETKEVHKLVERVPELLK